MGRFAMPAQMLPPVRPHGCRAVSAVLSLEESKRVTSGHNTRSLVIQQRCRVPLEDRRSMAEVLPGQSRFQSSKWTARLPMELR